MKSSTPAPLSRRIFKLLVLTALLLIIVHIVLKFVSIELFHERHGFLFELSNRFDGNDENSVPQWFSQFVFLLIAGGAGIAAYLQTVKNRRILWGVIAVLGLLLSLDDVATLHEFVLQTLHNTFFLDTTPSFVRNAWLLVLPAVLAAGVLIAWWASKALPRKTALWLIVGGAVYVIGKVFMDSLANLTDDRFLDAGIAQGLEKLFQYIGSVLVFYAVTVYLETYHGPAIARAMRQFKRQ